jgi:mRNA-degrading endonuclease RelE of RelBE toxin-antitoxin system
MSYKILPTRQFEKDFKRLDSSVKKRIIKKINEVAFDPTRYKHLRNVLNDNCRVWVDKYRVIFSYDVNKKELYLEKVVFGHRY